MASRTSNQTRSKSLDAGMNILSIVTAELQTANVTYFQRKIQLSGFSAYRDGSASQLIRINGGLMHWDFFLLKKKVYSVRLVPVLYRETHRLHLLTCRRRQYVPQKAWYPPAKQHGGVTRKTTIYSRQ